LPLFAGGILGVMLLLGFIPGFLIGRRRRRG
jgi:hypothetical protein